MINKLKSLRRQNMHRVIFAHIGHHLSQKSQGKSSPHSPHHIKEKCLQNYTLGRGTSQRRILGNIHATTSYNVHATQKNKLFMRYCT